MNPYKVFLDDFFTSINEYYHFSMRVSKVLKLDAEKYTAEGATYRSGTALIVDDWTPSKEDGFPFNFHSGVLKETLKEDYFNEINDVTSIILSSYSIHCYELLEKLLKKVVNINCLCDESFKQLTMRKSVMLKGYNETKIKGDIRLFQLIVNLCEPTLSENPSNKKWFKPLFIVLSKTRNSLVHTQNIIRKSSLFSNSLNKTYFDYLFEYHELESDKIKIIVTQEKFKKIISAYSGFAFQIYKMISLNQSLPILYNIRGDKEELS